MSNSKSVKPDWDNTFSFAEASAIAQENARIFREAHKVASPEVCQLAEDLRSRFLRKNTGFTLDSNGLRLRDSLSGIPFTRPDLIGGLLNIVEAFSQDVRIYGLQKLAAARADQALQDLLNEYPEPELSQEDRLAAEILEAETKALDSLARYKFAMFGYWAGIWVHLNKIEGKRRPSPFTALVHSARVLKAELDNNQEASK